MMKIIAGTWRGKKLLSPNTEKVRPTAEKGRQAMFNMLESRLNLQGKTVMDIFAGSGALGLEALSRGAEKAIFVDTDLRPCKKNIHLLGVEAQSELLEKDVNTLTARQVAEADVIFMDPPYGENLVPDTLKAIAPHLKPGTLVFAETEKTFPAGTLPFVVADGGLSLLKENSHGAATLTLLQKT